MEFDLPAVHGRARVLREQAYHVYALRFEALRDGARAGLERLVAQALAAAVAGAEGVWWLRGAWATAGAGTGGGACRRARAAT